MTTKAQWLDGLLPALEASGRVAEPRAVAFSEPWIASVEGTAAIADRRLMVSIDVHRDHPTSLPRVRVADVEAVGHLPHVSDVGVVCYHEAVGLSSSLWRPVEVVLEALSRALQTLERGLLGLNASDFVAEAEWYWFRGGAWLTAISFLRPSNKVKTLHVAATDTAALYLADSLDDVTAWNPLLRSWSANERGLFIPLEETVRSTGLDVRSLGDLSALKAVVHRHVSHENQRILAARLRKNPETRWIVIGVPRSAHDHALLGIDLGHASHPHALCRQAHATGGRCRPFAIRRRDREHLVARGGASMSLSNKKVAVVGCGALGGHVASALARSGIGALLLVDPDVLEAANLFRHVLGRTYVNLPKATALATVLALETPYLETRADLRPIQDALRADPRFLDRFDMIVNAVGDVTLTRSLNRELHSRNGARMVHTWLEPLGLGGHALLTAADGLPGCYECLFVDEDGSEVLHARSDLAAPDQVFHTMHAACGGAYTPYADLDARRTAEVAARMVIDVLRTDSAAPQLRTWKSDGQAFRAAGFQTSRRFELAGLQIDADASTLAALACPVCSGAR